MTSFDWLSSMRPCSGVHREAAEHHRVDRADLGAGQHGEGDFGDASHVDRDAVAFGHAHGFDDVREARDFAVHRVIRKRAFEFAVFAFPDQRQFILLMRLEMAVNRIVNDVDLCPHEPFEERLVRVVQDLVPLAEPFEFLGLFGPEPFEVLPGGRGQRLPVFQARLLDGFGGRIKYFAVQLLGRFDGHVLSPLAGINFPNYTDKRRKAQVPESKLPPVSKAAV